MPEAVQILFVEEDGTYRVDEEALSLVTSHEAARDLPVAVVSVAGATRGGKSFLLDFFLRYLYSTDEARRDGSWIGTENQPLTGFSWGGGWEPNTSGIAMWSEPIVITQQVNGRSRQLAVVLMDTQGTFDSRSNPRDSNTIFAMSTLMSSVQIYNLLQMINEDDLRHLQLFMEFGRMAMADSGAVPFQSLIFRVRDWQWPTRQPYGVEGGERFLTELCRASSLLREEIRPCFEKVSCVLTPYPGQAVTEDSFNGLSNVDPAFKDSLLEVVPFILDPANLPFKVINGNEVKTQELSIFIRTYMEVYNGDDRPPAHNIFEAMSNGHLEVTLLATRAEYSRVMERGGEERRVARGTVPRLHAAALDRAREAFTGRRTLASSARLAARLEELILELDARLPQYVAVNNEKITAAIESSKTDYRRLMDAGTTKCMMAHELERLHDVARGEALTSFNNTRVSTPHDVADEVEADDSSSLLQDVDALLPLYRECNTSRIEASGSEAREAYTRRMREARGGARCVHADALARAHRDTCALVLAEYDRAWTQVSELNPHRVAINNWMETTYEEDVSANESENRRVCDEALQQYDRAMNRICASERICLHPLDLKSEHSREQRAALEYFLSQRAPDSTNSSCPFKQRLENAIQRSYAKLEERNEALNAKAVKKAHERYKSVLIPERGFIRSIIGGGPGMGIYFRHGRAKDEAIELFHLLRREGPSHDEDAHLKKLEEEIAESYRWYKKCEARNINV